MSRHVRPNLLRPSRSWHQCNPPHQDKVPAVSTHHVAADASPDAARLWGVHASDQVLHHRRSHRVQARGGLIVHDELEGKNEGRDMNAVPSTPPQGMCHVGSGKALAHNPDTFSSREHHPQKYPKRLACSEVSWASSRMMALASATRFFIPPDSSEGISFSTPERPTFLSASATRRCGMTACGEGCKCA